MTCGYDPDLADLIQIILGRGRNDELRYLSEAPMLLTAAEKDPPDLIILPVMMVVMDGFEACRRLRQSPRLRHIPVLFCSAAHTPEMHQWVTRAGGQGYLHMPFGAHELLNARDALLRGETHLQPV